MRLTRKSLTTTFAGLFVLSLYGVGPVVMGLNLRDMARTDPGEAGTAEDYSATMLSGEDVNAMLGDLDGVPEAEAPEAVLPEQAVVVPPVVATIPPDAMPVEAPPTPTAEVVVAEPAPEPVVPTEPATETEGEATDPNHPGRMTREERLARLGEDGEGKTPANRPKKKRNCAEDTASIEKVEEGFYKVERDLVDYYTDDIQEAMKLAYVSWHRDAGGEIVGFKVRKIKCNSVLYQAGIRNGDIILTVNEKPVTSIPQALSAYRKLRKKNRLEVQLMRKDKSVNIRYRLT